MNGKRAEYTVYGSFEHGGERYVVTSTAPHSKYFARTWRADDVGVDPVVSVRDPGAPAADWYPEHDSWPESAKTALVNKSLEVYRECEASR